MNPKKIARNTIRHPLLLHGVFWMVSFYILLQVFSLSSKVMPIDFIYTGIFLFTLMVPVLINLYLLIPQLLRKGRFLTYSIFFLILLFLFAWFNHLVFDEIVDVLFPGYYFISYYSYGDILKFFIVFLGVTTLLQLSREWFELNRSKQRLMHLEKEKIAADLRALSQQVNPHFLFNSLNVLYSLAVNQRKETPEAIMRLSDMLRYVIYDSAGQSVSLMKEIEAIRNYIELQQFRVGKESSIRFDVDGKPDNFSIPPMLLLPLVENGFKHGIKGDVGETYLHINLKIQVTKLEFRVENNKGSGPAVDDNNRGIGLKNIRSRLRLIFPNDHKIKIKDEEERFEVYLSFPITDVPVDLK